MLLKYTSVINKYLCILNNLKLSSEIMFFSLTDSLINCLLTVGLLV